VRATESKVTAIGFPVIASLRPFPSERRANPYSRQPLRKSTTWPPLLLSSSSRLSSAPRPLGSWSPETTSPRGVHTRGASQLPALFRPQALSASRRFAPPHGSQVSFTLQPSPDQPTVQGFDHSTQPFRLLGVPCPLAVSQHALSRKRDAMQRWPRLRGFAPSGATCRRLGFIRPGDRAPLRFHRPHQVDPRPATPLTGAERS
jgi:hypothetical protein